MKRLQITLPCYHNAAARGLSKGVIALHLAGCLFTGVRLGGFDAFTGPRLIEVLTQFHKA